jgi:hypothetical protein
MLMARILGLIPTHVCVRERDRQREREREIDR